MTYIINPRFFYFASLLDSFWTLVSIVFFLAIIGTVGFGIWWVMEAYASDFFVHDDNESPFAKFCKKNDKGFSPRNNYFSCIDDCCSNRRNSQ